MVFVGAFAVLLATGCRAYDPVGEIDHREFADTASAVRAILDEHGRPRVYAVGEYHATRETIAKGSPLARFTREIIDLLEPRAKHMVVEAWLDDSCGAPNVHARVTAGSAGPPSTQTDLDNLVAANQRLQIATHGLPMTCIEHHAMFDPVGRVDFLRLLEMVTAKLYEATRTFVDDGREVIVYGGALHNDLYPHWPLEELSYAVPLAKAGVDVLELDLVVPEIVAPMEAIRNEPWFPLLGRASPERVTVWERGANSYVILLPAQSEAVASVALPRAQP